MCLELFLFTGLFMCFGAKAMVYQSETHTSPCPDTFRYQIDPTGELTGTIGVYTFDENIVQLNVELSVGNQVNHYNGRIELVYPKEQVIHDIFQHKPITYKLHFPRWENIPPKITKIVVNGQVVCTGPPITIGGWMRLITTINLQHTLLVKTVTPLQVDKNPFLSFDNQRWPQNDQVSPPQKGFNDQVSQKNPFINTLTTTTTTTTTERPSKNPVAVNDLVFPSNPFLHGKTAITTTTTPRNVHTTKPTTKPPPKRVANLPSRSSDICGMPIASNLLVVNGESVPRGAFPWLAAMFSVTNTGLEYKCSGSLISNKHVVTAAHCIEQGRKRIRADRLVLVLGKLNIKRWSLSEGEKMIEAEDVKVHPDYVPLTSDADLAVVILSEEVQFSRYIRPICLWAEPDDLDSIVGQNGKVVGWGRDEKNNTMTAEPRQTSLPIVSQEQCLWSSEAFKYVTSQRTFCAGNRNGAGPCNGDSGSGFIMKRDKRWVLRGVVSISTYDQNTQTCDLSNYVVFTDTSKFKSWLFSFL